MVLPCPSHSLFYSTKRRRMEQLWADAMRLLAPFHIQSLLMLFLVVTVVVGLCITATAMQRKKTKKKQKKGSGFGGEAEGESSWGVIKRVLVQSVQWSHPDKWARVGVAEHQRLVGQGRLLEEAEYLEQGESGSSALPFWQHRILMGERCELPRFSGLILYDEQGRPIPASDREHFHHEKQEKLAGVTLKDLL